MKAPSDMYFESVVQPEHEGWLLLDSLCARFTYHSREDWTEKLNGGLVSINGEAATLETIAHKGDKVVYHVENYTEPDVPTDFDVVFEDDEFMVVAKPAGVPVHHTGRIFFNTFTSIVRRGTDCETATPMHRLDRDTGGLMLFAKYAESAARFQKNLDRILLKKFYMAVVRGKFPDGDANGLVDCQIPLREMESDRIRLRMHGAPDGKACHTIFRKIKSGMRMAMNEVGEAFEEPYSVVEAELVTGRKHQIRAHLSELGFPILGDRLYSFDGRYYEKMAGTYHGGGVRSENSLSSEDFAVLGARSQMLYAYKAEILLPYWDEPRVFVSENYPDEMKKLVLG